MRSVNKHFRRRTNGAEDRARRTVDGHVFDSVAEAKRYGTLKMLTIARPPLVRSLTVFPTLPMVVNGVKIGRGYLKLDFLYEEWVDGAWRPVYEDFKQVDTRESKQRRAVCEAVNNVKIKVVTS